MSKKSVVPVYLSNEELAELKAFRAYMNQNYPTGRRGGWSHHDAIRAALRDGIEELKKSRLWRERTERMKAAGFEYAKNAAGEHARTCSVHVWYEANWKAIKTGEGDLPLCPPCDCVTQEGPSPTPADG